MFYRTIMNPLFKLAHGLSSTQALNPIILYLLYIKVMKWLIFGEFMQPDTLEELVENFALFDD